MNFLRGLWKFLRFASCLIVFLSFVAALLFDASHWIGPWDPALRVISIAALLVLIHRYNQTHFFKAVKATHHARKEFDQLPDKRAEDLQKEIRQASLVTLEQVNVFTRAVIGTSKLHQRIVEEYRPDQRSMQKEVTIDVRIPTHIMKRVATAPDNGVFLYPVLGATQGRVLRRPVHLWVGGGSTPRPLRTGSTCISPRAFCTYSWALPAAWTRKTCLPPWSHANMTRLRVCCTESTRGRTLQLTVVHPTVGCWPV